MLGIKMLLKRKERIRLQFQGPLRNRRENLNPSFCSILEDLHFWHFEGYLRLKNLVARSWINVKIWLRNNAFFFRYVMTKKFCNFRPYRKRAKVMIPLECYILGCGSVFLLFGEAIRARFIIHPNNFFLILCFLTLSILTWYEKDAVGLRMQSI